MGVKLEKLSVGQVIYYRFKQKMGRTTAKTIAQVGLRVEEVDLVERRVKVTDSSGTRWMLAKELAKYYDWSMYGPEAHREILTSTGAVIKVTRIRGAMS